MIGLTLLGCGGGMPTPNRYLSALLINYKGKKPYKITKGKFYIYYKLAFYIISNYYFLFPNKVLKIWKIRADVLKKAVEA